MASRKNFPPSPCPPPRARVPSLSFTQRTPSVIGSSLAASDDEHEDREQTPIPEGHISPSDLDTSERENWSKAPAFFGEGFEEEGIMLDSTEDLENIVPVLDFESALEDVNTREEEEATRGRRTWKRPVWHFIDTFDDKTAALLFEHKAKEENHLRVVGTYRIKGGRAGSLQCRYVCKDCEFILRCY